MTEEIPPLLYPGAVPGTPQRPAGPGSDGAPDGSAEAVTSRPSPRNRLAEAVRGLVDLTVWADVPDDVLDRAAGTLEQALASIGRVAPPERRPRIFPDPDRHAQDIFPTSPVIGFENPLAPPVRLWTVPGPDGEVELAGEATFGIAYEGPPTCVHGGVIAQVFDEVLGSVNIVNRMAGMTGTLTVRYRRPTPLETPITIRARPAGRERRKVFCSGAMYVEGELTAEADGIFIEADPNRMLDLAEAGARSAGSDAAMAAIKAMRRSRARVDGPDPG